MMADDEEPTLPPHGQSVSFTKRKRTAAGTIPVADLFSTSSDPAVFSSDNDPAVDNYVHGRHKRRYVGSWYQQRPATSESTPPQQPAPKTNRTFERQIDSGVWMGSDSSIDDILDDFKPPTEGRLPALDALPRYSQLSTLSPAEANAQQIIRRCIDGGKEQVDLSGLGLEKLSNSTVALLSEFMWIPTVEKDVPFEQKDPAMHLYLFNNQLTQVPGAIFNLEHLTVLSLRGNRLEELPPSISKLKNLEHLNISQNSLRYLPCELVQLILDAGTTLKTLVLHPNPFVQPDLQTDDDKSNMNHPVPSLMPSTSNLGANFCGRTPVQFSDTAGAIYSDFRLGPETHYKTEHFESTPGLPSHERKPEWSTPSPARATRVPSLLELALRSCARTGPQLETLHELLPDDAPPHLKGLLSEAHTQRETGGLTCSVCKKAVVRPTAEWVEWWEVFTMAGQRLDYKPLSSGPDERYLPFKRRVCSWGCALSPDGGLGKRFEAGEEEPQ